METAVIETRPGPNGPETREEREARILADTSLVTMRDGKRLLGLAHLRMRELHARRRAACRVVGDPEATDGERARALAIRQDPDATEEELDAALLILGNPEATEAERAEAREILAGAIPRPLPDKIGTALVWPANVLLRWGRRSGRLDEWYEPVRLHSPGRPPLQR